MSKTYRSVPVKRVEVEKVLAAHAGEFVEAGFDIGKRWVWTTIRFRDGTCLRPWRAGNPLEIGSLVDLLKQAGERVKLRVAMESSGTYGDPLRQALRGDRQAAATLSRFSQRLLDQAGIDRLVQEAKQSVGVRMNAWDRRRVREDAEGALLAHRQKRAARRRLHELARRHELIPALGEVVGIPTACVLWVCVGDPRHYGSGGAYRKAMGLTLAERSSGMYQ